MKKILNLLLEMKNRKGQMMKVKLEKTLVVLLKINHNQKKLTIGQLEYHM